MDDFLVDLWESIFEAIVLAFVNWLLALFDMEPAA